MEYFVEYSQSHITLLWIWTMFSDVMPSFNECQWIIDTNYMFFCFFSFFLMWLQATLAPPVTGKMFKGLIVCYSVVTSTFFTVACSGYWAYGNGAAGNLITNLAPDIPSWLVFLANMLILAQLFAVALVSGHSIKLFVECFYQCQNHACFLKHTLTKTFKSLACMPTCKSAMWMEIS